MSLKVDNEVVSEQTMVLAEYLAETKFEDFPDTVLEKAKMIIADTIGVAIRGSIEPEMQRFYNQLPQEGEAILLKEGFPKTNITMAGVANATAICFIELDEGTPPSGHPALHVFPPAFALSQFLKKSGSEFLTAFILGYETHYRLQKATLLRDSVNPHGNAGHIGAVVAVGKLLGWNAEQFRQGINCAAALPLGTSYEPCLAGSTIASVFASITSPIAFIVKDLIESGFTGYDNALADTFGNILGKEFNPKVLTDGLGSEYGMLNNYFKFHATCGVIHPVLDAAAEALNFTLQHDEYPPYKPEMLLNPDEVKSIKIKGVKRSLRLMYRARNNQISAKFSLPFALAVFLVTGKVDAESFSEELLENHQVRSLEKLIELEIDPNLNNKNPGDMPAEIIIELKDGKEMRGKCTNAYGRSENPSVLADLYNKFSALTDNILGEINKDMIWNIIFNLENQGNMGEVILV